VLRYSLLCCRFERSETEENSASAEREGLLPAGAKRLGRYKFNNVFGRSLSRRFYTEGLHHGNDQDAPIRPKKANGKEQKVYWIRKKVPERYRALVGKTEVWRSLKTKDRRTANEKIGAASAKLEREWARLAREAKLGSKDSCNLRPRRSLQTCV
jgi:hypothetical protein